MRRRLWAAGPAAARQESAQHSAVARGRRWCREHPGERDRRTSVPAGHRSGHWPESLASGQDGGRRPSFGLNSSSFVVWPSGDDALRPAGRPGRRPLPGWPKALLAGSTASAAKGQVNHTLVVVAAAGRPGWPGRV